MRAVVTFALAAATLAARAAELPTCAGPACGTTYRVTLARDVPGMSLPGVHREIEAVIARIDRAASTWRDDSDASRFARAAAGEWVAVSADLVAIVELSRRVHDATGGAFDVSVADADTGRPGMRCIVSRMAPPALRKLRDGVALDLDGIGPGYVVDAVGARLVELGSTDHLVELGGEVRVWGAGPDGSPWRVRVGGAAGRPIELADGMALATSTARPGRSPVDPRTGRVVACLSPSITARATSCAEADAWAVAALVLGLEPGPDGVIDPPAGQRAALPGAGRRGFGGRYPHLAVSNDQGECGIGAVVPWADRLWFITYAPHMPDGSDDGLYEVDEELRIVKRPESVGGTPAARLIHRETNQLVIGPYVIDADRNVRAVPPARMPGRLTAAARHLEDPARKVHVYDMEGLLYDLDLQTLETTRRVVRAVPGWHGKGAYSGQGVLVVANNGEHVARSAAKFEPFLYAVPNTRKAAAEAGCLAEWDGKEWRLVRRRQFTDVTGPGGIHGAPDPDAPLWAIGWDDKSVVLLVRSAVDARAGRDPWHTFRLPKSCASYDGDHGWHTEWPRIREVVPAADGRPAKYLLTMHGGWYELPGTFSTENPRGIRPLGSHLKITGDVAPWTLAGAPAIVFGCDDTARSGFKTEHQNSRNDLNGRSNSNLWFTTWEGLSRAGRPAGMAFLWRGEPVRAGVPSDPLLLAGGTDGYGRRVVHLAHAAGEPVTFALSTGAGAEWRELATVTVAAGGSAFRVLPDDVVGDWIRLTPDRDAPGVTAAFCYGTRGGAVEDAGLFAPLAPAISREPWIAAVVRSGQPESLPLDVLASDVDADGTPAAARPWRLGLDAAPEELPHDDAATTLLREQAAPRDPTVGFDAASVIFTEGPKVFRLPKPLDPEMAAVYEKPFATGWPRGLREVVTERSLLNAAGTFYVVPRVSSGGAAKMLPVCSHGLRITDFCSWRGLLVLGGVRRGATGHERVFGALDGGGPAVWVGDVDELWKLPKPTGRGGPWHRTRVDAGVTSDPYLMGGYDAKRLEIAHDAARTLRVTVEIDPTGDGGWLAYAVLEVPAGQAVGHDFPAGFLAQWVRLAADAACTATATFTYR